MKCDKCGAESPISVASLTPEGKAETLCLDCVDGSDLETIEPPLGWAGNNKSRVMRDYALVGYWGKEN